MKYSKGDKVRVPNRGRMVTGTVVRYDDKGPETPFYVVYVKGEVESLKVPHHEVKPTKLDESSVFWLKKYSGLLTEQDYNTQSGNRNYDIKIRNIDSQNGRINFTAISDGSEGSIYNIKKNETHMTIDLDFGSTLAIVFLSKDGKKWNPTKVRLMADEIDPRRQKVLKQSMENIAAEVMNHTEVLQIF